MTPACDEVGSRNHVPALSYIVQPRLSCYEFREQGIEHGAPVALYRVPNWLDRVLM